jgi:hypothetical protein
MSDVRARIVDALRENLIHYLSSPMIDFEGIADVLLSLPGIAITELPEVDDTDPDGCVWFSDGSDPGTVGAYPGVKVVHGIWEWTPEQARVVSAQWLAAANAAEATA